MSTICLNGAFIGQRVTGQQRYATEVSCRLVERPGVQLIRPAGRLQRHPGLMHLWTQSAVPVRARTSMLVSFTARSPLAARRHALVVHDLFVLEHPEWYSPSYARSHAALLRAQLRTASGLIAVSEPVAQKLRVAYAHKPIVVAPNAAGAVFDAPSVECLPAAVNDLLIGGNVEGYVLAVGSHDPRKNFARLVEAYRRLPGEIRRAFPLVIAGGASRIYAAGSDETDDDVSRLGYVSDPELAALYASASVVVMPSLDEGFGLPLVEARAARAKLAVSDIPVFRWVAGDTARYFDPLDVSDIASAVLSVLEGSWSPPEGAPIERRFDWATTADTIETFARALT